MDVPSMASETATVGAVDNIGVAQGHMTLPINAPSTAAPHRPVCASRRSNATGGRVPHALGAARHKERRYAGSRSIQCWVHGGRHLGAPTLKTNGR
jgi:hypothetical protein